MGSVEVMVSILLKLLFHFRTLYFEMGQTLCIGEVLRFFLPFAVLMVVPDRYRSGPSAMLRIQSMN